MVTANSHLTAINRNRLSAPARYLQEHDLILPPALDFGCGYGTDAEFLEIDRYDPHWFPEKPEGPYDTVLCTYVLNVLPDQKERDSVVRAVRGLLSAHGAAYITVRRDVGALLGWTRRNTWQGVVSLDLPSLIRNSGFEIYTLTPE